MRRLVLAGFAMAAFATPAFADCTDEVRNGYAAMAKKPYVRLETSMITANGPVKMVLDFQTPDRMRQSVTSVAEQKTVESIVIGSRAWTQEEKGWFELPPQAADEFAAFRDNSLGFTDTTVKFECLGGETLDGKQVRAYKLLDPTIMVNGKEMPKNPVNNEAVRIYYLDASSGLPTRAVYAHKDRVKTPIQQENYSFPESVKIEPPANVQAPPALVNEPKDETKK